MKIIYPPHPHSNYKLQSKDLPKYEKKGNWVAQRKFNGTNIALCITPDRDVYILTRHGTPTKQFSLTASHIDQILSLNIDDGKEYWFGGELLHNKTKSPEYKNRIVLFDVLQAGKYFYMETQMQRLAVLEDICGHPRGYEPYNQIAHQVTTDIWMAETFEDKFKLHYEEKIDLPEIEGLVLRDKNSSLDNFGNKKYDVTWIYRCRKPHKNYSW